MTADHAKPRPIGRPPSERTAAERRLRSMIVRGRFGPGDRIPPLLELATRLRISPGTAQAALASLTQDGFVEPRGSRGTVVADHPPHLFHYGVVSPYDGPAPWEEHSRFFHALEAAAVDLQRREPWRRMIFFHGIGKHHDVPDHHAALAAIRGQRLAGLIFLNSPHELMGSPLLEERGTPRVAVMAAHAFKQVPAIGVDLDLWMQRVCERLVAHGRTRPALLGLPGGFPFSDIYAKLAPKHGFTTRPYWEQNVSYARAEDASRCVQLLFHPGQDVRPDSLIVTDDHLAGGATQGLAAIGASVPRDVEVISLANFPGPPKAHTPVSFVGFDAPQIIRACVEQIDRQRRGEPVAGMIRVAPRFEDEPMDAAPMIAALEAAALAEEAQTTPGTTP
ncbi:MAG: GntR family transcriptional regulator [Planctomycetota bacterium]|nr:GntR family transcriptional regulator [Planctomycetota bacterium]